MTIDPNAWRNDGEKSLREKHQASVEAFLIARKEYRLAEVAVQTAKAKLSGADRRLDQTKAAVSAALDALGAAVAARAETEARSLGEALAAMTPVSP